jgi:hypothetical protein
MSYAIPLPASPRLNYYKKNRQGATAGVLGYIRRRHCARLGDAVAVDLQLVPWNGSRPCNWARARAGSTTRGVDREPLARVAEEEKYSAAGTG